MIHWAWLLVFIPAGGIVLGMGYLLGKKKKVIAQFKTRRDEILSMLQSKKEATKEEIIQVIKEKL